MKRIRIIATVFLCFIFFSCSQQLYVPVSTDATQQQQLSAGRKLYVDHCGSCHNLHLPKEYNAQGWKKQLDEMQLKAKISNEEKQLIFQFLTSQP
jgi:mono/diheme cytochrome c family protein